MANDTHYQIFFQGRVTIMGEFIENSQSISQALNIVTWMQ